MTEKIEQADLIAALEKDRPEVLRLANNVILSWKRGDISTTGTALLELENGIVQDKEGV